MKFLLLALLSLSAHADWDAVAVIVRPEKALVQLQEPGAAMRLRSFMRALSDKDHFVLASRDSALQLECGMDPAAAGCVIRFLPGESTRIESKRVSANIPVSELGGSGDARALEANFLNSNGDQFAIHLRDGILELEGSKRFQLLFLRR